MSDAKPKPLPADAAVEATNVPLPAGAGGALPEEFGRYRISGLLGRGAMGAVYRAQDTQLSRQVALKVPHFNGEDSDELLERFYREARAAATLRSPYICPVYDVGEIQGQHFISMACIEGKPLSALIKSGGPQKERAVLLLIRKLATALQEAHQAGVIHRDLKPGNIMIDARGEPVITDFGLAFQSREGAARLTHSGVIMGSPAYMSPEQLNGSSTLTAASDQFSLGVVLYELLTGELPFRGSISAIANQITNAAAPSPRKLRPDISPRTDAFCLKLLSKRPSDRFPSMQAVADDIAAILKGDAARDAAPPPAAAAAPASGSEDVPSEGSLQQQVLKLIEWGELVSALEILERPDVRLSGKAAAWVRQKRVEVRQQIQHWKSELPAQCLLATQLLKKHDYSEAAKILCVIPVGLRTDELNALLQKAQAKDEEVQQLQQDIEKAFRTGSHEELTWLVKRFLQLKPGHQQMRSLAADLQKYGPEQVVRQRRKQRDFLDPAGRIWEPRQIAAYVVGLGLACAALYAATMIFQSPRGAVIIDVLQPGIAVSFADGEVTVGNTGQSFPLKVGQKEMLAVRSGGTLVPEATQELSVERNETKRVIVALVDGKIELSISSEKKTFVVPPQDVASNRTRPPGSNAGFPPKSGLNEWTDLLAAIDPAEAGGSIMSWDRVTGVLIGTVKPPAREAWVALAPKVDLSGDYDLEVDYMVFGSRYVSIALPLNDTNASFSVSDAGSGLHWINGQDLPGNIKPPHGQPEVRIEPGRLQHMKFTVRHKGPDVTVTASLDGVPAGEYSGPRSRISIPATAFPTPRRVKLVSPIKNPDSTSRFEVHRARFRRVEPDSSLPALTAPQTPTAAPAGAPANTTTVDPRLVVVDCDFRKSSGGVSQADEHHILAVVKDGEYRYLGKKYGWWYAPFHPAIWTVENSRLKEIAVEFDIRLANSNKGEFAVEFGRRGDQKYCLCFNHDGAIRILLGSDEFSPLVRSPALKPVDQFNTVRMTVEKKTIRVSVNGQLSFEKKLEHYGGGGLVAWVRPAEAPFDVRLQRFRAERLALETPPKIDTPVREFVGHTAAIRDVAFLPDGKQAISVGNDNKFLLWDVGTGKLVHEFPGHSAAVGYVSVSGDGRRAITGSDDFLVRLWDLESRTLLKTLKGHTGAICSVLLSRDGLTAYSAAWDGTIRKWDLKSNAKPAVLPGPGNEAHLIFSPDESLIACSSPDGSIVMRGPKAAGSLVGHDQGPIRGLAFTPDGTKLVAGGYGSTVRVWDIANGKQIYCFDSDDAGFDSVAVTSNGRYVIGGCSDHTIRGWDLETGDPVMRLTCDNPGTHRLVLSPDNQFVFTGGGNHGSRNIGDFKLRLWKLPKPLAP